MQQGDCNAPATMMKLVNHIFRDLLAKCVFVYIDDIFIFSDTYDQHLKDVRTVLQRLEDNHLNDSKEKSQILAKEMEVLGDIVTDNGISANPQKIMEW